MNGRGWRLVAVILAVLLGVVAGMGEREKALGADVSAEYAIKVYGTADGLSSVEINAIAQSGDGYLWAGGYSGLYKYNGIRFEPVFADKNITSVMALARDEKGDLWIGTNDSGLACYEIGSGELTFLMEEEGLGGNSVRSLLSDGQGNLYAGTSGGLCRIALGSKKITRITELNLSGRIESLTMTTDGYLVGATSGGEVFCLKKDKPVAVVSPERENLYYNCVGAGEDGTVLVGTSGEDIGQYVPGKDPEKIMLTGKAIGQSGQKDIFYNSYLRCWFIGSDTGIGSYNGYDYVSLNDDDFNSSVTGIITDYQENIWAVSDKQGVIRLSQNPFTNVFKKRGLEPAVVNCYTEKDRWCYIGTNDGLVALNRDTGRIQEKYTGRFAGVRVRNVTVDSRDNVWVSTYGEEGLVCLGADGTISVFNEKTASTAGGRFRFVLERKEGGIVAFSNSGINFIENGKVVKTINRYQGKQIAQILDAREEADGSILAGSDGDGVYVIRDGVITDCINEKDGLKSPVVMKVVPVGRGKRYIYVTSSGLYYNDGSAITRLDKFPYSNNYDVLFTNNHQAWISSSAGLYVVSEKELLENKECHPVLLNYSRGLDTTLTANAWNYLDSKNHFYLCCIDGVRMIPIRDYDKSVRNYTLGIESVRVNGEVLKKTQKGYVIPEDGRRVDIKPAVLDYTLSNPRIHMYLKGYDEEGVTCARDELSDMHFTKLAYGDYEFHIQVLGEMDDQVRREMVVAFHKDARFYERTAFRIYLVLVVFLLLIIGTWVLTRYKNLDLIRRQYTEIRSAKKQFDEDERSRLLFFEKVLRELRQPVDILMEANREIASLSKEPPVLEQTERIYRHGILVNGILEDVVDTMMIQTGQVEIQNKEYRPLDMIADIYRHMRRMCLEKQLAFSMEADSNIPELLEGDEHRIRQIIRYLMYNVLHHIREKGQVKLRLQQRRILGESTIRLVVEVRIRGEFGSGGADEEDPLGLEEPEYLLGCMVADLMDSRIQVQQKESGEIVFRTELPQLVKSWGVMGDAAARVRQLDMEDADNEDNVIRRGERMKQI